MLKIRHFGLIFVFIGFLGIIAGNVMEMDALDVDDDELVNPTNIHNAEFNQDVGFATMLFGIAIILLDFAEITITINDNMEENEHD